MDANTYTDRPNPRRRTIHRRFLSSNANRAGRSRAPHVHEVALRMFINVFSRRACRRTASALHVGCSWKVARDSGVIATSRHTVSSISATSASGRLRHLENTPRGYARPDETGRERPPPYRALGQVFIATGGRSRPQSLCLVMRAASAAANNAASRRDALMRGSDCSDRDCAEGRRVSGQRARDDDSELAVTLRGENSRLGHCPPFWPPSR
jgi:hypothetical protein